MKKLLKLKFFYFILIFILLGVGSFFIMTENNPCVPVLMYHYIAEGKDNYLCVSPDTFDKQMKYLKDNNIHTLTLDEFHDFAVNKKKIPRNSVVITLDDGYTNNFYKAYPILKKYGINATIAMITGDIGSKYFLNEKQLKELDKSDNVKIISHTISHPYLDKLPEEEQLKELKESKETLEKILGRKVEYIAYPHGTYSKKTIEIAKSLGYKMALSTNYDFFQQGDNEFTVNRMVAFDDMEDFKKHVKVSRKHILRRKLQRFVKTLKGESAYEIKERSEY